MDGNAAGSSRGRRGDLAIGIGTILFGAIVAWQASFIPSEGVGSSVGPNVIPWLVACMFGVFGAGLIVEALLPRSGAAIEAEDHGPIDHRGAGWMILGLMMNIALIDYVGFIIASTLLFVCTARAFGSEKLARDAGIGFALALVAYVGFDRLLGYKIGSGLIERFI